MNRFRSTVAAVCLAAAAGLAAGSAAASSYTGLVVMGDSLSDTGNILTAFGFPGDPYFNGRFSNGPNWIDGLADSLGLSSAHFLAGGTNLAWGGAQTGPAGAGLPPSLLDQTSLYLSSVGNQANATDLHVVWGGGNDVLALDITDSIANLESIITDLSAAGATSFLVPNLPDIGLTPAGQDGPTAAFTQATADFNAGLSNMLDDVEISLGITVFRLDVFAIFNSLVDDPASFGFSNAADRCFEGGIVCADPDGYVFWDDVHPTAAAHGVLADIALETVGVNPVPVPAALPLLLSALGLLGALRRRRPA